ncbi:chromosome segregation protein [Achromobacter sp. 2789STDY5608615]|uniref:AAA family ATPase n=1 Tax=Achromobacter sp. 2789STDY5608615 TaxID=1806492 RepID=UPI0006C44FBB|nr:AAA family ATPase [Achromobacter sp. 2789STDY5608615]CUJ81919.1 chromosome segregation protein [Achromobacter sp. 2789STDY5608615]
MRINRITVENFQGARAVDLQLPTPLALVSGLNGAGKSTVAEAVRLALQGTPERVGLKKEYDMLVSDGAKLGAVTVELDAGPVSMTLPKGVADGQELVPTSPALPFVLAPERFALAETNDRRSLLFTLTGAKIRPDDIAARLLTRNCSAELVTQIKPILRTGFAAGSKYAKDQATQAKGAWRTVTGEVYGDVKAKDWAADEPAFDRAALESAGAELAGLDERIEATAQSLGKLVQKAEAYAAARDQMAARQAKAARLPELTRKLEFDLAEHGKAVAHVETLQLRAGAGPRVGLMHDLAICLDDVYNCEQVNLVLPGPLDMRILEVLEVYEAQYGKLDAPPRRRRRRGGAAQGHRRPRTDGAQRRERPPRYRRRARSRGELGSRERSGGDRHCRRRRRARAAQRHQGAAQGSPRARADAAERQAGRRQRETAHFQRGAVPR